MSGEEVLRNVRSEDVAVSIRSSKIGERKLGENCGLHEGLRDWGCASVWKSCGTFGQELAFGFGNCWLRFKLVG